MKNQGEMKKFKKQLVKLFILTDAAAEALFAGDSADDGPGFEEVRLVEVEVRRPPRHHQHVLRPRATQSLQGRVSPKAQGDE